MAGFKIEKSIAAPPGVVFGLVSDFRNAASRIKGIKSIEMLGDGPTGVGTRFVETRVMFGKEARETMEVTSWDPPCSYTLGCTSCGCRYETVVTVNPEGTGSSVEMSFEARPLSFFARIMAFMMSFMLKACRKACEQDLDDIRAAAEGGAQDGEQAALAGA